MHWLTPGVIRQAYCGKPAPAADLIEPAVTAVGADICVDCKIEHAKRQYVPPKAPSERREFESGSVRDTTTDKGRYDLISPHALRRLARVLQIGAVKYAPRNWEKGQPIGASYLDSGLRHIVSYMAGDMTEDHLGHAFWNLMAAIHTEDQVLLGKLPLELLDVGEPNRQPWHASLIPRLDPNVKKAVDEPPVRWTREELGDALPNYFTVNASFDHILKFLKEAAWQEEQLKTRFPR